MKILIALLSAFLSKASEPPSPSLLEPFPKDPLINEVLRFKPIAGHHLSTEAPQKCPEGALIEKSPKEVICQFTSAGEKKIVISICDDKKTFCKQENISVQVQTNVSATPKLKKEADPEILEEKKKLDAVVLEGFEDLSYAEAEKKAKTSNQMSLVVISAQWCPPCNDLKEFLYPTENFKSATANFKKFYVDGDSAVAAEWDAKLSFFAYPTLVCMNEKFEEVDRVLDYQTGAEFKTWILGCLKNRKDPIKQVQARVEARLTGSYLQKVKDQFLARGEQIESDYLRLADWYRNQNMAEKALSTLKNVDKSKIASRLRWLEYEALKPDVSPDEKRQKARAILENEKGSKGYQDVFLSFCEDEKAVCTQYLADVLLHLDKWPLSEELTDFERLYVTAKAWSAKMQIYDVLEDKKARKLYGRSCVDAIEKVMNKQKLTMSRGPAQMMLSCLLSSEDFERAEKLLQNLVRAYPKEATFFQSYARVLKDKNHLEKAYEMVKQAEKWGYGLNWVSAIRLKADIENLMGQKAKAVETLNSALKEMSLSQGKEGWGQSSVAAIRKLKAKIESESKVTK